MMFLFLQYIEVNQLYVCVYIYIYIYILSLLSLAPTLPISPL